MSGTPYIRFFGDDWLSGTQSLTLEERGVLITLVAITATAGEAPAYDVERLARRLGCTRAKTIKLMDALCETGKITIEDGRIYQPRALKETKKAQENSEKQTKIAHARWSKSGAKVNENKTNADATALPRECQPEPEPEPLITEANASVSANDPDPPKRNGRVRGAARRTKLPDNWQPSPSNYAFASKSGLTNQEIAHEADQFRNHARAEGRLAADWHAAFRTWLGNTVKWRAERAARTPAGKNSGGKPRGGGLVAAGLRHIGEARGYGEPVPDQDGWGRGNNDMGAGQIIDGEVIRHTGS